MLIKPHPTLVLSLASVSVSLIALPLGLANQSNLGGARELLCIGCALLALVFVVGAIWAIFVKWEGSSTHPSLLMGSAAVAVSAIALPMYFTCSGDVGLPHQVMLVVIAVVAMLLTSSCLAFALGRIASESFPDGVPPASAGVRQHRLQAFPASLASTTLDDIADTYECVRSDIMRAVQNGTYSRHFVSSQAAQLRSLADRVSVYPTADAIRADARLFVRKARCRLCRPQTMVVNFIQRRCRQRFAAAVLASRQGSNGLSVAEASHNQFGGAVGYSPQ
ncbi:MAG: hypothetical protein OXE04_01730 [bacterium]|nr:hypothetical protein [bacterium]